MSTRMMFVRAVTGMAACVAFGGCASADCDFKPPISYVDGCEEFRGPARGYAPGGWVVFQPEGLPKWHGAKACNTTLWELSRFSGGREQKKKRPPEKRVGKADIPLTDAMKADVRRYLEETRRNGGSLIVRIGYTWSDSVGCEPSNFDIVLGHIRDLSKIMADFDDVVIGVEAGVAGPWGEMHSSDYCKPEYMKHILKTYCDNLPENISILVRTPHYIASYAGTDVAGTLGMLPFKDRDLRRFGMYNDGYLGTWWDYGTWSGHWKRERGCQLLKALGDHPYGGELAYVSLSWLEKNREKSADLFDIGKWNIVKDWYETHLNYLRNGGDRKHPLCKFIAGKTFRAETYRFEGMPELKEYDGLDLHKFMTDHMGWRFVLRDARLPKRMSRGMTARAVLVVENTGFGKLLLPSRTEAVFVSEKGNAFVTPVSMDGGGLSALSGGEKRRFTVKFDVPKSLASGTYSLYLRVSAPLKDEKPGDMPRRPVRLANAGMWNETLKANALGAVLVHH